VGASHLKIRPVFVHDRLILKWMLLEHSHFGSSIMALGGQLDGQSMTLKGALYL